MPKINISIPHHLTSAEARTRIKALLRKVTTEHADRISDLREEWSGDVGTFSLSAMSFPVSGTVAITPAEVQLTADLPFAASLFKSKIESTIRDRAAELLA